MEVLPPSVLIRLITSGRLMIASVPVGRKTVLLPFNLTPPIWLEAEQIWGLKPTQSPALEQ